MIKAEDKGMMVRGVVAISTRWSGCLSTDIQDCEERGNAYSVTKWHRHDDLEGAERELDALVNVWRYIMSINNDYDSLAYAFDYKPYKG